MVGNFAGYNLSAASIRYTCRPQTMTKLRHRNKNKKRTVVAYENAFTWRNLNWNTETERFPRSLPTACTHLGIGIHIYVCISVYVWQRR